MAVETIHIYLIYPNKSVDGAAAIIGNEVPHEGDMCTLMRTVYEKADTDCNIGIAFNQGPNGAQVNDCRNSRHGSGSLLIR